jgi:hypothetical protein
MYVPNWHCFLGKSNWFSKDPIQRAVVEHDIFKVFGQAVMQCFEKYFQAEIAPLHIIRLFFDMNQPDAR